MSGGSLLLAAGWGMDEILKIIVMVVFGLIYLFNHLFGAGKAQKRRPARPAEPRPAGRPEVQDEVAEFLRRAAEKRAPAKRPDARPAAARRPIPAESVEPRAQAPSSRFPQPMHSQVDNPELAQRAAQLGHVDQTEAAFQAHMQTFEHSVGSIREQDAPSAPALASPADGNLAAAPAPASEVFAAILADAQSLRHAIILNEIIRRPEERW